MGEGKSIWGTCAGMILLAKEIEGPTSEGWKGLDGIDVRVGRNSYGRQVSAFRVDSGRTKQANELCSDSLPRSCNHSHILFNSNSFLPIPLPFSPPSSVLPYSTRFSLSRLLLHHYKLSLESQKSSFQHHNGQRTLLEEKRKLGRTRI